MGFPGQENHNSTQVGNIERVAVLFTFDVTPLRLTFLDRTMFRTVHEAIQGCGVSGFCKRTLSFCRFRQNTIDLLQPSADTSLFVLCPKPLRQNKQNGQKGAQHKESWLYLRNWSW